MEKNFLKYFVFGSFLLVGIFLFVFVSATFTNSAPVYAGNGTNITMFSFNVSNLSITGDGSNGTNITSITINNTGTATGLNITMVTIWNSTSSYSNSSFGSSFPGNGVIVYVGNFTGGGVGGTTFYVNFTINSTATHGATLRANLSDNNTEVNISFPLISGNLLSTYSVIGQVANPGNLVPSTDIVGNGSNVSMFWFSVANASHLGNNLTSVVINNTGTATGGTQQNITGVTIWNGTSSYSNFSFVNFSNSSGVVVYIGNISGLTNFTVNFTINSTASNNATIQANLSSNTSDANVTFFSVNPPYNSTTITIDSAHPNVSSIVAPVSNANLTGTADVLNATITDRTSLSTVIFNLSNGTSSWSWVITATNTSASSWNATLNTTNISDGSYNVTIKATDAFGNINASRYVTIISDNTNPNVSSIVVPVSSANLTGTADVLNATISDATTSIETVRFNVSNGSGEVWLLSATSTSATSWNATLNTTNLTDGNYNVTVVANDSANNINNTKYVSITVDNTNPGVTASCSSVNIGDSFSCSCSRSDATSGINTTANTASSTSSDGTSSPVVVSGAFTYSCGAIDFAGNSASSSATYNVGTGGGGSGSGSGGGEVSVKKVHSISKISPGVALIIKDFDSKIGIKEISINVNNSAQNVKITVTKYDGKPAQVSVAKTGKIYQYLQINTENLADKLDKAVVKFRIEKTWATNNSLSKENISISKYDETANKWNELTTAFADEDNTYYYYNVELGSFSYFAISEKSVSAGEGAGGEEEENGIENAAREIINKASANWILVIIGIVVVLILLGVIRAKRR